MKTLTLILIGVACSAIFIAGTFWVFLRVKNRELKPMDRVIGILFAGPLFGLVDQGLKKRQYKLTKFEFFGLILIIVIFFTILVGAIVANFHRY
jgi:uncharacterized membrane protein YwzB